MVVYDRVIIGAFQVKMYLSLHIMSNIIVLVFVMFLCAYITICND